MKEGGELGQLQSHSNEPGKNDSLILGERLPVHLGQELVQSRPIAKERPGRLPRRIRIRHRHILERMLRVHVHRVDAETIAALLEPEGDGVGVDGLASLGVLPVEVGLLGREEVEVVLVTRGEGQQQRPGSARGAGRKRLTS